MFDDDFSPPPSSMSGWSNLSPNLKSDLIFLLPFIFVDFFNYYSAGAALIISGPIMLLLYLGSGALCSFFALRQGRNTSELAALGAVTGAGLWLVSTIVNALVGVIVGTASLGATLLLGVPYLCLCAPINLIGGAIAGAIGAWLFSILINR